MSVRRVLPAIALFFLSPLVAEFLLGDFTVAQLPFLVLLAPAYGGAAVLVREVTRRTGRGWPTMILLSLAYGVIEEGLETQSLFNPNYLDAHLLDQGFVPALGIAVPWTLFVLTLHTVWSLSVPIALVEEYSTRRTTPWLRAPGLTVFAVLAAVGAAGSFGASYGDGHFMASPAQLATTVVIAAALIVAAFRIHRGAAAAPPSPAPSYWLVLAVTLVAGALFEAVRVVPTAAGIVLLAVLPVVVAATLLPWSARPGWDGRHRLAAASGALLTYAWHSFFTQPVVKSPTVLIHVSHAVLALAALALVYAEARRLCARSAEPLAAAA
jgi:hypothetical protein